MQNIIEICVAIDIAILGIAYPIIIDKISNIGDKYSSEYTAVLFNDEFPQRRVSIRFGTGTHGISLFRLAVYLNVIAFIPLILNRPAPKNWDNWFVNNSAQLIVLSLSSALTFLFFLWLNKVFIYNGRSTVLLKRLVEKYDRFKSDSENKTYCLKAINEMTLYSVEKQDAHLQETLLQFYYQVFSDIRKQHDKNKPLVYPVDLYFMVNNLCNELANSQTKRVFAIEHRAVSGLWLLGEDYLDITISEETYLWLWRNLTITCNRYEHVKMFWANSSQYFDFRLAPPREQYIGGNVVNKEEVEKREVERYQFKEFHYAFGGLLLYSEQYKSLRYLLSYTQSQPPKYVLLPQSMTEIFYWFEQFRNEFKRRGRPLESKFYFPDLDNLGTSGQITYWICSYLAILFIRQFTLQSYYIYQNPTAIPDLPTEIVELNNWLDSAAYFESCLSDLIDNQDAIRQLEYQKLIDSKRNEFFEFLEKHRANIRNKIKERAFNVELSKEKISNFFTGSSKIIDDAFNAFSTVFKKSNSTNSDDVQVSLSGGSTYMSKSAFTEGDIPHINYHEIFAELIVRDVIHRQFLYSFVTSRTSRYLIEKNKLIRGLDRLIGEIDHLIIVAVNVSLYLRQELDRSKHQSIVRYIHSSDNRLSDTLCILSNKDLPAIEFKEPKEESKQKFQLQLINDALKLYASVIEVKPREVNSESNDELQVRLTIEFNATISWPEKRKLVQINITSEFKEQGIQNEVEDIKPFDYN